MWRSAMAGAGTLVLTAAAASACWAGHGSCHDWTAFAFRGGWQGCGPAAEPPGPVGPQRSWDGDGVLPPQPIGPVPSDRSFVPPIPPLPAWRILAGEADGFEYVMLSDPDEHPRATMLKVCAPGIARVYLDNRELKQGHDCIWRFVPREPLQLHLPNVHTVRVVIVHDGETYERFTTFRLQPGRLLRIIYK
jgi:hypothetical protein